MEIRSKWARIAAMILIGMLLVFVQYFLTGRASGVITGGILYFVCEWLGGKW